MVWDTGFLFALENGQAPGHIVRLADYDHKPHAAVAWHQSGGGAALCPLPYGGRVVVEKAATAGGAARSSPAGLRT